MGPGSCQQAGGSIQALWGCLTGLFFAFNISGFGFYQFVPCGQMLGN